MEKALEPKTVRDRGRPTSKRPSCAERRWHLPVRCDTGTSRTSISM